jgi:hypothetical protein
MDKQEERQAAMDEWRDTARKEDKVWRRRVRNEDIEWREKLREEDTTWREKAREEDTTWREKVRQEDIEYRLRNELTVKRCCALSAAAQSSQRGTPPEEIFALAGKFENWLNSGEG